MADRGTSPGTSGDSVLYADVELAARIEAAEVRLLTGAARAARQRRPGEDVFVQEIAGGAAVYSGPGSPFNKVAGLGFHAGLDGDTLAAIEREFARRGTPVQIEVATLADPTVYELLTRRGYLLRNFENVLGRRLPVAGAAPEGIEVTIAGEDEVKAWLDVVVEGFAAPEGQGVPSHEEFPREALEKPIGDLAATAGFVRYLARREGVPAGAASLRIDRGVAQLCGAATLPAHRRCGVQGTLLARRLADAGREGCDVAVATTQPGSKSQENVQRCGFSLLYARAILVREG